MKQHLDMNKTWKLQYCIRYSVSYILDDNGGRLVGSRRDRLRSHWWTNCDEWAWGATRESTPLLRSVTLQHRSRGIFGSRRRPEGSRRRNGSHTCGGRVRKHRAGARTHQLTDSWGPRKTLERATKESAYSYSTVLYCISTQVITKKKQEIPKWGSIKMHTHEAPSRIGHASGWSTPMQSVYRRSK